MAKTLEEYKAEALRLDEQFQSLKDKPLRMMVQGPILLRRMEKLAQQAKQDLKDEPAEEKPAEE